MCVSEPERSVCFDYFFLRAALSAFAESAVKKEIISMPFTFIHNLVSTFVKQLLYRWDLPLMMHFMTITFLDIVPGFVRRSTFTRIHFEPHEGF